MFTYIHIYMHMYIYMNIFTFIVCEYTHTDSRSPIEDP